MCIYKHIETYTHISKAGMLLLQQFRENLNEVPFELGVEVLSGVLHFQGPPLPFPPGMFFGRSLLLKRVLRCRSLVQPARYLQHSKHDVSKCWSPAAAYEGT